MAKHELFTVIKVGDDLYENNVYHVKGTREEVEKYARENGYDSGVVVYLELKHGHEWVPIQQVQEVAGACCSECGKQAIEYEAYGDGACIECRGYIVDESECV